MHDEAEGTVFEWGIAGTDYNGVPTSVSIMEYIEVLPKAGKPNERRTGACNRVAVPGHDIVCDGGGRYTGGRIGLHTLSQVNVHLEEGRSYCLTLKSRISLRRAAVDMLSDQGGAVDCV